MALIPAQDARTRVEALKNMHNNATLSKVEAAIQKSIEKGACETIVYEMTPAVESELNRLGYTVSSRNDPREGTFYFINW